MLLTARQAPGQEQWGERCGRRGKDPVGAQQCWQSTAHGDLLGVLSASSYARAVIRLSSCSTCSRATSCVASSASADTRIAVPTTLPSRLNGNLHALRRQF